MANTYTFIASTTIDTPASNITFSSIPATYTDLKIVASMRVTDGGEGTTPPISRCEITFNTGSSYTIQMLYGIPGASTAVNAAGGGPGTRSFYAGAATSSNATASTFASSEYYISNYTSSNNKSFAIDNAIENNATSSEGDITSGLWSGTATISTIKINPYNLGNFAQYTTMYLYGIKNS
jgi:hypothetical protein